jgi:hypothetical protein
LDATRNQKLPSLRSVEEIQEQLADLAKVLAEAEKYGEHDLAGKMGLRSLRQHQRELLDELCAAVQIESATEPPMVVEGLLVGGSIAARRFELVVADGSMSGEVDDDASEQMKRIRFGERVRASLEVRPRGEAALPSPDPLYRLVSVQPIVAP